MCLPQKDQGEDQRRRREERGGKQNNRQRTNRAPARAPKRVASVPNKGQRNDEGTGGTTQNTKETDKTNYTGVEPKH